MPKRKNAVESEQVVSNVDTEQNVADQINATTEMGVPLAPDRLFEVNANLQEDFASIKRQIQMLQELLSSKVRTAGLTLGVKADSQIVLSPDLKYIAEYSAVSIKKANSIGSAAQENKMNVQE